MAVNWCSLLSLISENEKLSFLETKIVKSIAFPPPPLGLSFHFDVVRLSDVRLSVVSLSVCLEHILEHLETDFTTFLIWKLEMWIYVNVMVR